MGEECMTSMYKAKKERDKKERRGKGEERNREGEREQKIGLFTKSKLVFLINQVLSIYQPKPFFFF